MISKLNDDSPFTLRQKIEVMRKYEPDPFGNYLECKSHQYRSSVKIFIVITAAVSLIVYLFTL